MANTFTTQISADVQGVLGFDFSPKYTPLSEEAASKFSQLATLVGPVVTLNSDQEALLADLSNSSQAVDFDLRQTQLFNPGEGGIFNLGDQSIAIDASNAPSIKSFYGKGSNLNDEFGADYTTSGGHDINVWFDGGAGDDDIYGGNKADQLQGGIGNDYIQGGAGDDYFVPGAGADFVDGYNPISGEVDAIRFDFQSNTTGVELKAQSQNIIYVDADQTSNLVRADVGMTSEGDVFVGVEQVYITTGSGNDVINAVDGVGGYLEVERNESNRLQNGAPSPRSATSDTTYYAQTGGGDDIIKTSNGDDIIEGGIGDDYVMGGAGADTFILDGMVGVDTIADFMAQEGDKIAFRLGFDRAQFAYDQGTGDLTYRGRTVATLENAPSNFSIQDDIILPEFDGTPKFGAFTLALEAEFNQLNGRPAPAFTPVEIGGISLPHLFDQWNYLNANTDVAGAVSRGEITSAYDHFVNFGLNEGRDPSSLYSEQFYLVQNGDVANAVAQGAFESGLQHFLLYGHVENRAGSAHFDAEDYLTANPDVAAAVQRGDMLSAFDHYVEYGMLEGRAPGLIFDEAYYTEVYDAEIGGGLEQYVTLGQGAQHNPSELFSESYYLSANPDVAAAVSGGAFSSGFEHFAKYGRFEERAFI